MQLLTLFNKITKRRYAWQKQIKQQRDSVRTGRAVMTSPIAFIQAVMFSRGTSGWLQNTHQTHNSTHNMWMNMYLICYKCCWWPLEHHIEQSVSHVFARHSQSHELHTGNVKRVCGRVGKLVEAPVTVGERPRGFTCHGWIRLRKFSQFSSGCKYRKHPCISSVLLWGRPVKDIIHQPPDEFAVVRVVGDPDVVVAGVHSTLQVGLAETPARGAVVLERAHDGMDQLPLQVGAISQVPLVIMQRVVQVRHRTICMLMIEKSHH